MHDRIDALSPRPERLAALRGRVLDERNDQVLDAITREAARDLRAASCLVSLVLERLQLIRSGNGLTEQDRQALAVDRDLSLCQYVVRDRALVEIPDAALDPRVPGQTLREFGVRSYLGAPISVSGEVVGSLCIIDDQPRQFTDSDREALTRHATKVSTRLAELAAEQRGHEDAAALLRVATRPVFQDLRNGLWQLTMSLDEIRVAAVEAQRLSDWFDASGAPAGGGPPNLALLSGAIRAAVELQELSDGAQRCAERVQQSLLALEAATQPIGTATDLAAAVTSAARLSGHFLRLVGGLSGVPLPSLPIHMAPAAAIVQVSTALATLAHALLEGRVGHGVRLSAQAQADLVTLRLATDATPALHAAVAAEVRALLGGSAGVTVDADAGAVSLAYRAAAGPADAR